MLVCFWAKQKELTHHKRFSRDPSHRIHHDQCWLNLMSQRSDALSHWLGNKCISGHAEWVMVPSTMYNKRRLPCRPECTPSSLCGALPLLPRLSSSVQKVSSTTVYGGPSVSAPPYWKGCVHWCGGNICVAMTEHLHTGRAVFTGMVAISVWLWQNCMNRPPGFLWTWYLQLHAPPGCTPRHFSFSAQPTVWTKQGVGMGKGFPRLPYTWHIGMVASLSTLVQIPCLWLISRALYYLAIKSQRQETHSWRGVIVCFTSLLTVDRILLSPIMNIYLGGSTLHTPHTHTHKIAPFTATVLRSASKLARVAGRDVCSEPQVFLLSEGLTYRMVNLIFIS
jgi:hypothetical protein